MKTHVGLRATALILTGFTVFCGTADAIEVIDPGYMVETYVVFDCAGNRPPGPMAFDPEGNLYIIHHITKEGRNGSIYRVDPDRNVSRWITGLSRPLDIIWAGGSDFGEYLYVLEGYGNSTWSSGGVSRVSLNGIVTPFSGSGLNQPTAMGIDMTGNYGGYMYAGNGAWDNIEKVLLNGQVQSFSEFPYNISGSPIGIVFDADGSYGGLMYVSVYSILQNPWKGLFTLDTSGNPIRFAPEITRGGDLEFDTTAGRNFGGYLYAVGYTEAEPRWNIYRVHPNGNIEKFITGLDSDVKITFGPDGFLYVIESSWGTKAATVSRIIPRSPAFKLQEAIGKKEEALEMVEQALVKEQEIFDVLEEMLGDVDPFDVQYKDLVQAKVKIQLSMLQERSAIHHLNMSIDRLKEAWMILTGKDEYPSILDQVKQSVLRRADINGDGVIDAKDFAVLSRYWLKKYDR